MALYHIMLYYIILYNVILYNVITYYITLYYIILYHIICSELFWFCLHGMKSTRARAERRARVIGERRARGRARMGMGRSIIRICW